jgi:hypothetical protein
LSSAVCFTPPEFTASTPLQNSVFALGLDCRREVVVSVTSSTVCYRMLSITAGLHMIQIDSVAARISWRCSPSLELPARVCVQAVIAPLGCNGSMGTGPQVLFANRCWSIVIDPCVACASIGDNLATMARRYSVDPVAIASIFFAARPTRLPAKQIALKLIFRLPPIELPLPSLPPPQPLTHKTNNGRQTAKIPRNKNCKIAQAAASSWQRRARCWEHAAE